MNRKQTVSDIIPVKEIHTWVNGDIITIEAGTGRGKSHFVKNGLYNFAKAHNQKILFLVHRTNCYDQFKQELEDDNKTDVIDLKTYQHLEALFRHKKEFDFSEHMFIVADEFHYFMSDAAFNKYTDISLNMILEQNNTARIFMSATGDYMERYIMNYKGYRIKKYSLPIDFNFIKELLIFNKDSSIDEYIGEAIKNKVKTIFFIQSATKAYELYKKYEKHAIFNCSKSNKLYKHVNQEKIKNMLQNEKFDELILITTTCMDAGVNIIDKDLKHIVCDTDDLGTLIQCIGRKRIQNDDDFIYLYVKSIHNKRLGGMITKLRKRIEMANFFKTHTVQEYIEKYQREYDSSYIVYDDIIPGEEDKGTKKLNELMYYKCLLDIVELESMLDNKKYGYNKYLAKKLDKYNNYYLLDEEHEKMELEEYLESIVGERLMKEEQKELKEVFNNNGLKSRTLGINTLNGYLKDRNMPYIIEIGKRKSFRDEEGKVKKDKSHWIVGRITY